MTRRFPMGLSAHLGYLFLDVPLRERFAAAKNSGFDAVEHPQPFEIAPEEMLNILSDHDLAFAQMAGAVGDGSKGEKGLAALPGREADFLTAFKRSVDYAETIGCPLVHPMAGVPAPGADPREIEHVYAKNIEAALDVVVGRPVKVLVEAISHAAVPGYYMHRLSDAFTLARKHDDEITILLDTFHARANGEDAISLVTINADRIGHVHIADHPGRHEPGTGVFAFEPFLEQLKRGGYSGFLGFEYVPSDKTIPGLTWIPSWQKLADRQAETAINQDML